MSGGGFSSGYGQSSQPQSYGGGFNPYQRSSQPQTSGLHPYRPPGAPPVPSFQGPEGAINQPMDKPMQMPQTSGLHPMNQFPSQAPQFQGGALPPGLDAKAQLANTASVAGFQNPFGFSQQQLGPSFNPQGSAQGGYFNGQQYVPNVGNARNGLDTLNRFGMNWNGAPLNGGGMLIR